MSLEDNASHLKKWGRVSYNLLNKSTPKWYRYLCVVQMTKCQWIEKNFAIKGGKDKSSHH